MKTKLNCTLNQHYWRENGVYQEIYSNLWNKLVPSSDMAETIHGELIRCISRLYYDFCNNGNCNVVDIEMETCRECDGCGYHDMQLDEEEWENCYYCDGECNVEGEVFITDYYDEMLSFLRQYMVESKLADELRDWIVNGYENNYSFSDEQMNKYDKVVDAIVYQCLTTENKPNPFYVPKTQEA